VIHEMFGSLRVELPEDPRQSAKVMADVATAWAAMLETIGLEVEASLTTNEGRAKRAARKPRLVANSGPPLGSGHDVSAA
jgi:hypothetical protein